MTDSQELLAEYVRNGSESAFRKLLGRYLDFVYSTAVRLVNGDTHLAEDVAQMVFVDLAKMARDLPADSMLGGWLHRHTCFVAGTLMRGERRRQARERQAFEMRTTDHDAGADFAELVPALDEAINELGDQDRTAILLRFFERRNLRSIGETLGSTENAAQKRVERALEQLHTILKQRGIALSAAALGTSLAAGAVTAAPADLAASIAAATLRSAAVGGGTTLTFLKLMTMTKLRAVVIGSLVVAGLSTSFVVEHNSLAKSRAENHALLARSQDLENQLGQMQQENQQMAKLKVDADGLRALRQANLELPRLRGKMTRLEQENANLANALKSANARGGELADASPGTNQSAAGFSFKTAMARNSGFGTLPATLQTVTWAAMAGTPEDICRLEGQAATAPDGSPTEASGHMVQFYQNLFKDIDSVQVLDMTPRTDGNTEVLLQLHPSNTSGSDTPPAPTLAAVYAQRGDAGWQLHGWSVANGQPVATP